MVVLNLQILLWFSTSLLTTSLGYSESQVGCVKCHPIDDRKINVHMIPHSHDDLGWCKTVDQYYFGLHNEIQLACVECIISTVVEALSANPDRRFIQVETAFFWKWWTTKTTAMKEQFKKLVENGQIELVNGAWAMNDEACTNYQSTIDQFTLGLEKLKSAFGSCGIPRIGWQIDPFGHSREQASILAQLGYDGIFFARLDHSERTLREQNKQLDFAWQGSVNLDDSTIFASIFPGAADKLYFPPDFMCWDYLCGGNGVDDDPSSPSYNIEYLKEKFRELIHIHSQRLPTKNVIIPMGGDFQYQQASVNYRNMDRFIKSFRNDTELNVIYSTPSCYIKAVNDAGPTLRLKTDDFFPYSDENHAFWSGYFTSRPNSKRFERTGHNILQVAKQLNAIQSYKSSLGHQDSLEWLENIMGILQHHDAITGTEKQNVADDYIKQLSGAIEQAEKPLGSIISELLSKEKDPSARKVILELSSCLLANVSICTTSQQNDRFVVAVYNPLSWSIRQYVRLPVSEGSYQVNGQDGIEVSELIPNYLSVFNFGPIYGKAPSKFELVFAADDVPPMGLKLYYVNRAAKVENSKLPTVDKNEKRAFEIDPKTNLLKSITLNGITLDITQNFYYYQSGELKPASGAYLFRPKTQSVETLKGGVEKVNEYDGKLVYEFQQKWKTTSMDVAQSIRWYKSENTVEFDWTVGNIDIDDSGKEVITRYTIKDFTNQETFYTDANGREMITRKLNFRPTYDYNSAREPVSSNYYPVTSKIVVKDDKRDVRVAILIDRSEGGTSLKDGEIELMVHRRLRSDDERGVSEALNEIEFRKGVYVRGSHHLVLGKATAQNPDGKTTAAQERILAQKKLLQPWIGLATTNLELDQLKEKFDFQYSALKKALPENVNILTFQQSTHNSYILRLEHILEKNEDPNLSKALEIDLKNLFQHFRIAEITETKLAGTELLKDYKQRPKYSWKTDGNPEPVFEKKKDSSDNLIAITPMQIRTFVVTVENANGGVATGPIEKLFMAVMSFLYLFK